jgi:hypothetical protein
MFQAKNCGATRKRGGRRRKNRRKRKPKQEWKKKVLRTEQWAYILSTKEHSPLQSRRRTMVQPYSTISPKI